ncbi:flavodoxin domain-containing protein, partial [Marinilabilia sp.]|uniref:diflavin oxidoreductase n=1 Tax=Marinilabilia sp. TaxID=2021252 RepID=UPI0025C6EFCF
MIKTNISSIFKMGRKITPADVTILYGSKSGNARFIAEETARYLKSQDTTIDLQNMKGFSPGKLATISNLFIVVSTHGEGEPPPSAVPFYEQLFTSDISLQHLSYSICALGDSDYEFFCQAGKNIEQKLNALGAQPLIERADCDTDFRDTALNWIQTSYNHFLKKSKPSKRPNKPTQQSTALPARKSRGLHTGIIESRHRLNPHSKDKIFHIVLTTSPEHVTYYPGDCISMVPMNPGIMVDELLHLSHCQRNQTINYQGNNERLDDLLLSRLEITSLSGRTITKYYEVTRNQDLASILKKEERLKDYIQNNNLLNLIIDFPGKLCPDELVAVAGKIKPRYYSIASSQLVTPEQIHLTVKQISYQTQNKIYYGACSSHLSQFLKTRSEIQFRVIPNENFRLPKDPGRPIIMISSGTGIAPFIGFLQQRNLKSASQNWLIFGEKNQQSDFLYKEYLTKLKNTGILTHLDLAFSRDQNQKVYVQYKIKEKASDIRSWLNQGAVIYACGSVKMGKGVRTALDQLAENNVGSSFTNSLVERGQYFEDL